MDIDLVYLWVDGSDPVWRAKKAAYEQGGEPIASEAVAEARFVNNDELKYSLRSVPLPPQNKLFSPDIATLLPFRIQKMPIPSGNC